MNDSEGNISEDEVNNVSKHDNIIEGTIQVENFVGNWKRRKDVLFISETKNKNEDTKCSLYEQKEIVHYSDEEYSPDNSDSSHAENFTLKTIAIKKFLNLMILIIMRKVQKMKQIMLLMIIILEKDMLVPVNKSKRQIDNYVRDYCKMNDQEFLTSDNYRIYIKFMIKKTGQVN